jgi:type VI secretion system secreted protein VgrG
MSVVCFSAHEWISHIYTVRITISTTSPLDPLDDAIEKEALFTIVENGDSDNNRYFHGITSQAMHLGLSLGRFIYEVDLVPSLWRLTLRRNCRIFQEMHVQEIIKRVLQEGGIPSDRYRIALMKEERKRRFCVQYRESDFDFISRLMEEEGLFYFFQHFEDKHVMVIADYRGIHSPISGCSSIPFNGGGLSCSEASVSAFSYYRKVGSGSFVHRNFNFKRPSLDLTSRQSYRDDTQWEVYDYPALHTAPEAGRRLATVRMEELVAQQSQGNGQTSCCRLVPGHLFTLTDHSCESFNIQYLILNVIHTGTQPQVLEELGHEDYSYDADFSVIDASIAFRPMVTVKKPVIPGFQTAVVVGPAGEEIYTDEYGRIKVRFHWDRNASSDERSSCWLRINQPWSGSTWGIIAIPRIGDEVLVAFLDGDPDRPIVVGSVNNAGSPSLYPLPQNRTQTGIRTQSTPNGGRDNFHELRFEDRKGSEEVYLRSERDLKILVKNDKGQVVGNDETLLVKHDRNKTVLRNHTESIGLNNILEVGADMAEHVMGSRQLNVSSHFQIVTGESFEIRCGSSVLRMHSDGSFFINGARLEIGAAGVVKVTGKDIQLN